MESRDGLGITHIYHACYQECKGKYLYTECDFRSGAFVGKLLDYSMYDIVCTHVLICDVLDLAEVFHVKMLIYPTCRRRAAKEDANGMTDKLSQTSDVEMTRYDMGQKEQQFRKTVDKLDETCEQHGMKMS